MSDAAAAAMANKLIIVRRGERQRLRNDAMNRNFINANLAATVGILFSASQGGSTAATEVLFFKQDSWHISRFGVLEN